MQGLFASGDFVDPQGDAHIDPAVQTDFTEISGEFVGTLGAM